MADDTSSRKRSVRFVEDPPNKKAKKDERNLDELDDVDEWQPESEEDQLRHRRYQQQRRNHRADDSLEETEITDTTTLASEGVAIEPFHMDNERNDGSGYFEGDTYVFRRNQEASDAWLESIGEDTADVSRIKQSTSLTTVSENSEWSDQDLYAKILPNLLSPTSKTDETVTQALVRYGRLLTNKSASPTNRQTWKDALEDITEASSELFSRGKTDVYDLPRSTVRDRLPKPVVTWEYQGRQDRQIHGPYTTAQMQGWIQQGFFVGDSAVLVRTTSTKTEAPKPKPSMQDDLLSDLLDDDDEGDEKEPAADKVEKPGGEWKMSDRVDFSDYA